MSALGLRGGDHMPVTKVHTYRSIGIGYWLGPANSVLFVLCMVPPFTGYAIRPGSAGPLRSRLPGRAHAGWSRPGRLAYVPTRQARPRPGERASIDPDDLLLGKDSPFTDRMAKRHGRGRPQPILTWTATGAVEAQDLGGVWSARARFSRGRLGWHLRSWKPAPACQTWHEAQTRHQETGKVGWSCLAANV